MKPTIVHLLADDLTRTHCGLPTIELPREQVSGLPRKTTCRQCHAAAIENMYRNYEANTAPPLRGLR